MLDALFSRGLRSAERKLGLPGSMDYLRAVARASPSAFLKFSLFLPLAAHRTRLPADAAAAARLAATLHQDCGSCVQVVVATAQQDGVLASLLQSLVEGRLDDVPEGVALSFRFARAVAAQEPEASELRDALRGRFGEAGLVDLALAISTAQTFSITKRALGFAESCALPAERVATVRQTA